MTLACELTAWTQILALAGNAYHWEPERLRLHSFAVVGQVRHGKDPAASDCALSS